MSTEFNLRERAAEFGISLSDKQVVQFKEYYQLLIEWNERINLTAITKMTDVMEKHFIDSMMVFTVMDSKEHERVIDIGTGAGFPSVPMKIVHPDLDITLVDALQKRVHFLNELSGCLQLPMKIIHGRAEELSKAKQMREGFDCAVSRAVAKLSSLAEYVLASVAVGGMFNDWAGLA